jgi:hypothetical protein
VQDRRHAPALLHQQCHGGVLLQLGGRCPGVKVGDEEQLVGALQVAQVRQHLLRPACRLLPPRPLILARGGTAAVCTSHLAGRLLAHPSVDARLHGQALKALARSDSHLVTFASTTGSPGPWVHIHLPPLGHRRSCCFLGGCFGPGGRRLPTLARLQAGRRLQVGSAASASRMQLLQHQVPAGAATHEELV